MPEYSAVILAGGSAGRFGTTDLYKEKLGGKSLVCHAIDLCDADERCREIIISVSPALRSWIEGEVLTFGSTKMKLVNAEPSRMQSSVACAKMATARLLLIMDGNRPYISDELLERVLREAAPGTGCAPMLDCTDIPALRGARISSDAGDKDFFGATKVDAYQRHLLERHLESGNAVLLQTPQAYVCEDYLAKAEAAGEPARFADDSELYVAGGGDIALVEGRHGNFRVVSRGDLKIMQKIMGGPAKKKKDGKYGGLGW